MKYHEFDNINKYRVAKENGFTTRYQAVDGVDFDGRYENHEIRSLMSKINISHGASVLVCGTGTGADSCWLADQGFNVTGVDLIQDAIDIAKRMAVKRSCNIRFVRDDLTNMKNEYGKYHLIVDSFCLQSIVLDNERREVFKFVREHLESDGYYMVMCAGYSSSKDYSDSVREEETGIVYMKAGQEHVGLDDIKMINGIRYVPTRRHHTLAMFVDELAVHGFKLDWSAPQDDDGGLHVIARLAD